MMIFNRVVINRNDRFAEVHSYAFAESVDDDYRNAPVRIRLITQTGSMDIAAEDLGVLFRAIQLFKHAEHI